MNKYNKPNDHYEKTSEQLDSITTTVIATLLTGFIVSQQFIEPVDKYTKIAAIFAVCTLLLHYVSFITAHFAQIQKVKNKEIKDECFGWLKIRLGWLTRKINGTVYFLVVVMFIISVLIIVLRT